MPGMGGFSGMGNMNMSGMGGIPGMEQMGGFPAGNVRIFRNGQPVDMNTLNKPPPIIKNVFISLEQAYKGDQVPVQIERWLFEDGIRKCENETLYIPIAKGTDDKEMIILRDKGNVMDSNLKGDVKIVITIQNTTMFKREGLNLHMEREITLKDSLCGFDFIINDISGISSLLAKKSKWFANIPSDTGIDGTKLTISIIKDSYKNLSKKGKL